MTLPEFLLARIAEDEALAVRAAGWFEGTDWSAAAAADLGETFGPPRVLAECEAKRKIVELHRPLYCEDPESGRIGWVCETCDPQSAPKPEEGCDTLKLLALPYADHPDYPLMIV